MGLTYANYVVPQAPQSSLADLLPQFQAGQQRRRNDDATQAASTLGQPNGQPQTLASLGQQQSAIPGPAQPQQPMLPMPGTGSPPPTVGDRASQLSSYLGNVAQAESGNNPNAVNTTIGANGRATNATGTYQFLPSTWADVSQKHPELGLTPDGITDPTQQQKAMQAFTLDNAKTLAGNGIAPNPGSLYAAHFLGADGAVKALSASDDTPIAAVAPAAAAANANIANMTVGQFKQWAQQQGGGTSGGYSPPSAANLGPGAGPPNLASVPNPPQIALPPQASMLALLRSPDTRPLAMQMIQASRAGQDPSTILGNTLTREQIANYGIPPGYVRNAQGGMQAIPGGPEDPNNPLNGLKINPFAMSGGNSSGAGSIAGGVGLGADGNPDPQQQAQFLQALPPNIAAVVKGVGDYDLDPTKIARLGPQRAQIIALAQQYNPGFDMTRYAARAGMQKSLASGPLGSTLTAVNTTIQHLQELDGQADELGNMGGLGTVLNGVKNAAQGATGNPAQTTFQQTAQAVADEASKVFKGSGASDVETIRGWLSSLPMNGSPEQLHAAIANLATKLLPARLDTLQQQYAATMGGKTLPGFLTRQSMAALQSMGIDPTVIDPASAGGDSGQPQSGAAAQPAAPPNAAPAPVTATNPQTGEKLMLQNGQWVKAQ